MFTIRCTRAILDRLRLDALPTDSAEPTTTLGDWYANRLNVGRLRLLICTSERSLLTVLLPARQLDEFPERLRNAVGEMLLTLGVSPLDVARERREMASYRFDRTRSRRVLGSMNDLAFMAETHIRDDGPDADLEAIARRINRSPCGPINYASPDRLTPTLFQRAV